MQSLLGARGVSVFQVAYRLSTVSLTGSDDVFHV